MKNVVITGANRGIGLEFVCQLLNVNDVQRIFALVRSPENAKV